MYSKFSIFILLLIFNCNLFAIEQYKNFFNDQYPSAKKIYDKYHHKLIKKLIQKIILEGQTKNVPSPLVVEYLKSEHNHFQLLEKWVNKYKIKEIELLDNIYELIRNDFSKKILTFILDKKEKKHFREKFAKSLYFYINYLSYDLLDDMLQTEDEYDFKNQDISLISYAVFKANPSLTYINDLLNMMHKLKTKKLEIDASTRIIYKMIIEKKPPQQILDSVKLIPDSSIDSNY